MRGRVIVLLVLVLAVCALAAEKPHKKKNRLQSLGRLLGFNRHRDRDPQPSPLPQQPQHKPQPEPQPEPQPQPSPSQHLGASSKDPQPVAQPLHHDSHASITSSSAQPVPSVGGLADSSSGGGGGGGEVCSVVPTTAPREEWAVIAFDYGDEGGAFTLDSLKYLLDLFFMYNSPFNVPKEQIILMTRKPVPSVAPFSGVPKANRYEGMALCDFLWLLTGAPVSEWQKPPKTGQSYKTVLPATATHVYLFVGAHGALGTDPTTNSVPSDAKRPVINSYLVDGWSAFANMNEVGTKCPPFHKDLTTQARGNPRGFNFQALQLSMDALRARTAATATNTATAAATTATTATHAPSQPAVFYFLDSCFGAGHFNTKLPRLDQDVRWGLAGMQRKVDFGKYGTHTLQAVHDGVQRKDPSCLGIVRDFYGDDRSKLEAALASETAMHQNKQALFTVDDHMKNILVLTGGMDKEVSLGGAYINDVVNTVGMTWDSNDTWQDVVRRMVEESRGADGPTNTEAADALRQEAKRQGQRVVAGVHSQPASFVPSWKPRDTSDDVPPKRTYRFRAFGDPCLLQSLVAAPDKQRG